MCFVVVWLATWNEAHARCRLWHSTQHIAHDQYDSLHNRTQEYPRTAKHPSTDRLWRPILVLHKLCITPPSKKALLLMPLYQITSTWLLLPFVNSTHSEMCSFCVRLAQVDVHAEVDAWFSNVKPRSHKDKSYLCTTFVWGTQEKNNWKGNKISQGTDLATLRDGWSELSMMTMATTTMTILCRLA